MMYSCKENVNTFAVSKKAAFIAYMPQMMWLALFYGILDQIQYIASGEWVSIAPACI